MAAYAALVSLTHTLNQILNQPPTHHIIINTEQIVSLRKRVTFLIEFLENYSIRVHSKEIEDLETRIADAAYVAEDIIEPIVMKQILATFATDRKKLSTALRKGVETVIVKLHSIKKELVKIKDEKGVEDLRPKISRSLPRGKNNTMVGYQEHLIQIMGALATDESNLRIIPIVGMGGIGKTTLATNVYNNLFIVEQFDIHAWITISQEYAVRELLLRLLHQVVTDPNEQERSESLAKFADNMGEKSDDQLGEVLYKELFERKYLIVMDDMWNIQAWDRVKMFLSCNSNGSRVLVTTRLLKLAVDLGSCSPYKIDFLDEEQSWDLLREKVFAQDGCPVELEEIGKRIAKRCGGLPLALVVIGGLLAKSKRTREHWEYIEGGVASSLSYSNLPVYVKPCFLYLAVFPEDFEFGVSRLVRLWVAEGFIKPTSAKTLEEVAEEYLEDLIDRNLVLVRKLGSNGKAKTCNMHDLLRDLCKIEAHKDRFLRIVKFDNLNISPYLQRERRLSVHYSTKEMKGCEVLMSGALNRSLFSYSELYSGLIVVLLVY